MTIRIKFTFIPVTVLLSIIIPMVFAPLAYAQMPLPSTSSITQETANTITTVGGEDLTLTFDGITQDGITIGETSVTSQYPFEGMTFTVPVTYDQLITDVTLHMAFPNGTAGRVEAEFDEANNIWFAHPFHRDGRSPAWRHFDFFWRVITSDETSLDSPSHPADYWDPTREWFRYESDYAILYWFGLGETEPQHVAQMFTSVMDEAGLRLTEGFGFDLGYQPIFLLFPSAETAVEVRGTNTRASGINIRIGLIYGYIFLPNDEPYSGECIYTSTKFDTLSEQERVDDLFRRGFSFGYTYMYRFASQPNHRVEWWLAGQAAYFSDPQADLEIVSANDRLWNLSELQDLPTLQAEISTRTNAADGCSGLSFDVGTSFIEWIVENHGGLATHAQIMANMRDGDSLYTAIEKALGMSFLDIENAWRESVGFDPILPEDLDPTLALTEPVVSLYIEGDKIDIAGPRPLPLNEAPGPNQLSNVACFLGSQAEIIRVGSLDGINYYELECDGLIGWLPEDEMPLP